MEFLEYLLALFVLFLLLFRPQKESLAFKILWLCIGLDIVLWIAASASGWLPGFNL